MLKMNSWTAYTVKLQETEVTTSASSNDLAAENLNLQALIAELRRTIEDMKRNRADQKAAYEKLWASSLEHRDVLDKRNLQLANRVHDLERRQLKLKDLLEEYYMAREPDSSKKK